MIFQFLPLKKGKDVAGHNVTSLAKYRRQATYSPGLIERCISTAPVEPKSEKTEPQNGYSRANSPGTAVKKTDQFTNRDFFLSVLGSSATKRDARAYLQRFTLPNKQLPAKKKAPRSVEKTPTQSQHPGVNLGSFYGTKAVHESPKFIQQPSTVSEDLGLEGPLHIALVKLRTPQHLDDDTLSGVARTLARLGKLGLTCTIVVDCDDSTKGSGKIGSQELRSLTELQADRLVAAIDVYGGPGARKLDQIIGISAEEIKVATPTAYVLGRTHVKFRKLLMAPLMKGTLVVVPAVGYTDDSHHMAPVKADDVVLALARELAGFQAQPHPEEDPLALAEQIRALRNQISLDRLIVLDPLGGIPTAERLNGYHIFLNLEQEYCGVKRSLFTPKSPKPTLKELSDLSTTPHVADIAYGNPLSQFLKTELQVPSIPKSYFSASAPKEEISPDNMIHLQNLELVRRALSILPPSSSALLTTPIEAATSEKQADTSQAIGVGTRRQRNPLIYNLLTDKPALSSSLPAGRLSQPVLSRTSTNVTVPLHISPTTFVKRGMSVTIFPDPHIQPWKAYPPRETGITLTNSRIDLPRLVHLIEDSFNRKLDVETYLKRVNDRIAGVIIAGEYEGGALLTWELPPGVPDNGSEESRARMVPYLDKFAVLKRSQGTGGVADILFKSMVKDCFPNGVCWRSRRDNPVNKWYFERSRGTWKIHNTNWAMFWTTPDLDLVQQKFKDYEGVCRSIEPSWADKKVFAD